MQPNKIEIYIEEVNQLFNSMDPSPFREKDLDQDAEEYMLSWAQEFPLGEPLQLVIHVKKAGEEIKEKQTEEALKNYFEYKKEVGWLNLKQLLKRGRTSLVVGLVFLAFCLLIESTLPTDSEWGWVNFLKESLTIVGWVGMWRPMEIFLYDWWPIV